MAVMGELKGTVSFGRFGSPSQTGLRRATTSREYGTNDAGAQGSLRRSQVGQNRLDTNKVIISGHGFLYGGSCRCVLFQGRC